MQSVIETAEYLRRAQQCRISEEERAETNLSQSEKNTLRKVLGQIVKLN